MSRVRPAVCPMSQNNAKLPFYSVVNGFCGIDSPEVLCPIFMSHLPASNSFHFILEENYIPINSD